MKKISLYFTIVILLVNCQTRNKEKFDTLIVNATILDIKTGGVFYERLIGITNDSIRLVDNMTNRKQFNASNILDAENKYVMPGLWDMHVHFRGGDSLINENKNLLPLFLAFGITTVRDAGGDITPSVLNWREQIKHGVLIGPHIFTSGPKLDGVSPSWEGSIKVETQEDVKKALDSLESLKVDYVKTYAGSLTKEAYYDIIQEAEKREFKTTGHMPYSADILEAESLGLDGVEHMFSSLKSCSPIQDSINQISRTAIRAMIDNYDPILAKKTFEKLGEEGFFITPTFAIQDILKDLAYKDHSKDSLLTYIGEGIVGTYQKRIERAKKSQNHGNRNMYKDVLSLATQYIPEMQQAGINLLAGSDSGAFNSYCYPGQSLIDELILMVEFGLTPQQALTTSVINGPHFFELETYYGSIEAGKVGDIIILDKNPLESITNILTLKTLVKRGEIYDINKIYEVLKSTVKYN